LGTEAEAEAGQGRDSIIQSLFDYLKLAGIVTTNPVVAKLVPPPTLTEDLRGRALTSKEVSYMLVDPDRSKPDWARDYALLLLMLRISLRVDEACSLKASSIRWSHGRWTVRFKVKGGSRLHFRVKVRRLSTCMDGASFNPLMIASSFQSVGHF
jgi:site-specific recombinase XerD